MSKVMDYVKKSPDLGNFDQEVPVSWKDRRVTVRLPAVWYGALLLVARRTAGTPTGAAFGILLAALEDAIEGLGYASIDAAMPDIVKVLGTDGVTRAERHKRSIGEAPEEVE